MERYESPFTEQGIACLSLGIMCYGVYLLRTRNGCHFR